MEINEGFFVEVFRVDHGAVNIREDFEFRGAADVVTVAARAVADEFVALGVLADLAGLEGLDHAVLLRHTANPFV
jgi:hypothetical protein